MRAIECLNSRDVRTGKGSLGQLGLLPTMEDPYRERGRNPLPHCHLVARAEAGLLIIEGCTLLKLGANVKTTRSSINNEGLLLAQLGRSQVEPVAIRHLSNQTTSMGRLPFG